MMMQQQQQTTIMSEQGQYNSVMCRKTTAEAAQLYSKGFEIHQTKPTYNTSSQSTGVVTPTSTPPIRVLKQRRRDAEELYGVSPSPPSTENQKKYYEDSTWRMYDRIQASRPITLKNSLVPPHMDGSAMLPPSQMFASYMRFSQTADQGLEDLIQIASVDDDEEEDELIFDLEM